MPADITPTPFSTSKWFIDTADSVVTNETGIAPTTTSTAVNLGVLSASNYIFNVPFVQKTVYSAQPASVLTVNISNVAGTQVTVTRTSTFYTTYLLNITQYHTVVPTNATVWSSLNTSSSILYGSNSDIVGYKVALVADTVV